LFQVFNYESVNGEEPFADPLNSTYILPLLGFTSISSLAQKEIDDTLTNFSDWQILADFVHKFYISGGHITGKVTKDQILKVIENQQIARCYLKYQFFSKLSKQKTHNNLFSKFLTN